MILFLIAVWIVFLFLVVSSSRASRENHVYIQEDYDKHHNMLFDKADHAVKLETKQKYLDELESHYQSVKPIIDEYGQKTFENDIQSIKDDIRSTSIEKWEDSISYTLQNFEDLYLSLTSVPFEYDFYESAVNAEKKCIRYWKKYCDALPKCPVKIELCEHLRSYLFGTFDPCMLHEDTLKAKLDKSVEQLRPAYEQQKHLSDEMLLIVNQHSRLRRCDLLKSPSLNADSKTIQYAYSILQSRKLIEEEKTARYYYVSITDKGRTRAQKLLSSRKKNTTDLP